jgi:hypothetical protein
MTSPNHDAGQGEAKPPADRPERDEPNRRDFIRKSVTGLASFALVAGALTPRAAANPRVVACGQQQGQGFAEDTACASSGSDSDCGLFTGQQTPSGKSSWKDNDCGTAVEGGAVTGDSDCGKASTYPAVAHDDSDCGQLKDSSGHHWTDQDCGKNVGGSGSTDQDCSQTGSDSSCHSGDTLANPDLACEHPGTDNLPS